MNTHHTSTGNRWTKMILMAALGAALVACGGGGGGSPASPADESLSGNFATPSSDGSIPVSDGLKAHFDRLLANCPNGETRQLNGNRCAAGTYYGHDLIDPSVACSVTIAKDSSVSFTHGALSVPAFSLAEASYLSIIKEGYGQQLFLRGTAPGYGQRYYFVMSNRPRVEISLQVQIENKDSAFGPLVNTTCNITH